MSRFRIALAGLAAATGLLVPAGAASASTPAPARAAATAHVASKINGCPVGDACMYTVRGWNGGHNGHPQVIWPYDHCFVLHNVFGDRIIFNLQRGGEKVKGYRSANCSGTRVWVVRAGQAEPENMTPINSVRLG